MARKSIQVTFSNIIRQVHDKSEEGVQERLNLIADTAVNMSPVDTGAYVKSFSMVRAGQGGGRSKTSRGKPRVVDEQAAKAEARANLASDIASLPIAEDLEAGRPRYTLRNRAPHVDYVEQGIGWKRKQAAKVFQTIRSLFG